MWCRWRAGYHVREIARAFGRDHGSIRGLLARRGGIAPSVRTRGSLALTLIEREDISRGIVSGESGRSIAVRLGRSASTVSREIIRHRGRGAYRAKAADEDAWGLALRPKPCLLALNRNVCNLVASKLVLDWSPEQISGWLKDEFPDDESMRVSHETIYRSLCEFSLKMSFFALRISCGVRIRKV
jgi:IS30 family transposase